MQGYHYPPKRTNQAAVAIKAPTACKVLNETKRETNSPGLNLVSMLNLVLYLSYLLLVPVLNSCKVFSSKLTTGTIIKKCAK